MITPNFIPYEMKTSYIRVWEYSKGMIKGTIENAYYGKARQFDNLTQLLLAIDNLCDELKYPQRAMEDRTFRETGTGKLGPVEAESRKPIAMFKVNILFRQSASWQGSMIWTDKNVETHFRSALEFVKLLDEALTHEENP